jgi:hypothetical protein
MIDLIKTRANPSPIRAQTIASGMPDFSMKLTASKGIGYRPFSGRARECREIVPTGNDLFTSSA